MKIQELDTPAAGTWSRDCELIRFSLEDDLQLIYYKDEDRTHWEVEIWGIISYKLTCEEFSKVGYLRKMPVEGAFYEIIDSPWLDEFKVCNRDNIINNLKHYVLQFYDETIEFLAEKLIFKQIKEKPPGIEHYSFQKWDDQGRPIPD
jgi:hypothetical protein